MFESKLSLAFLGTLNKGGGVYLGGKAIHYNLNWQVRRKAAQIGGLWRIADYISEVQWVSNDRKVSEQSQVLVGSDRFQGMLL